MRTVDMDAIREKVGDEPCADCPNPSETFIVNAEATVYVCFGCYADRHAKRAEELKADRAEGRGATQRFLDRMAHATP